MALMEEFVSHVVQTALEKHRRELVSVLERDVSKLENVKAPFPRITYSEAVEVIQKAGHPMKWGDDIGGDEETVVASQFDRPVMVHRHPAAMKAFYFKKDPADPRVALRVGPRPAPLRVGSPRGVRDGRRALRGLDLRAPPRPGDDPLRPDDGADHAVG